MPEPNLNPKIGLYRSGVTSTERLRHTSVAREHVLDNATSLVHRSAWNRQDSFAVAY